MSKHEHRWQLTGKYGTIVYRVDIYRCPLCGNFQEVSFVKPFRECEGISYEKYMQELKEAGYDEPLEDMPIYSGSDRKLAFANRRQKL